VQDGTIQGLVDDPSPLDETLRPTEPVQPSPSRVRAGFPPKLIAPLFQAKNRYIVLYGGRGGGKSHGIAMSLLIKAANTPLRILCCREFMSSIKNSVHKLLCDKIIELGLQDRYIVERSAIYGKNGSEFSFDGIRNNVSGLKSYEGYNIAYCTEAANFSKHSWDTLIPTIRRPGSQIIIDFNPELATDETYRRFVVNPPPDSVVIKINFDENPFFPEVLRHEADYMQQTDPDGYQNVWLGHPRVYLDDAVYGRELREATEQNRICKVAYDPLVPVSTFWDLGWRDSTAIIFAQLVNHEFHLIDFLQSNATTTTGYLKLLQQKDYVYGDDWLPHDGFAKAIGTGRSIQEIMTAAGRKVRKVPKLAVTDGINATRTMFSRFWIDEVKCADLIQSLRKYRWSIPTGDPDEDIGRRKAADMRPEPVHDEWSHACDALRGLALSLRPAATPFKPSDPRPVAQSQTGWMR
jgi:phage terminase large subunit